MSHLTTEQWELIKTILAVIGGVYALLERPLSWLYNKINKKLIVEIENKEWKQSGVVGGGLYDIRWDVFLKFTNKLGKYTVIDEIRLEYNDDKRIAVPEQIDLIPEAMKRYRHNFDVGINVSKISGKLVIHHTQGNVEIPINEKYSVDSKNIEKDTITASTAKRNR